MAELLIKATSASHPDPEVDESGCYKKGDIVPVRLPELPAIAPAVHTWSA